MHLSSILFMAALTPFVAAQAEDNVRGVIYTEENYGGKSFKIRSSNCIRLRKPLLDNIRSIHVTLFQECTLYYERECESGSRQVVLYEDTKDLEDAEVKAVKCVDVDAEM